jgi:hypothetical protein
MGSVQTVSNGVPKQQVAWFNEIVGEMANGERPPYEEMDTLVVHPPNPLCLDCFDSDTFHLMPVHLWSPEQRWHHRGLRTPCHNHGWAHVDSVRTYPAWTQRYVKGVFDDFCIAGQRTECSECRAAYYRLKAIIKALKSHNSR